MCIEEREQLGDFGFVIGFYIARVQSHHRITNSGMIRHQFVHSGHGLQIHIGQQYTIYTHALGVGNHLLSICIKLLTVKVAMCINQSHHFVQLPRLINATLGAVCSKMRRCLSYNPRFLLLVHFVSPHNPMLYLCSWQGSHASFPSLLLGLAKR